LTRRRGFGIVIGLAVFLVLVLSVVSLSLGRLGSSVKLDVQAGQEVSRARFLAQAALEELAFRIPVAANDPTSAVHRLFRQGAFDARGGSLDVIPDLARARPWLKTFYDPASELSTSPDVTLTGVVARILHTRYFRCTSAPQHEDLYGTLGLEAHVAIRRGRGVATEIVADKWLEFKVVQPGLTAPFSELSLAMIEPEPWVHAHARFSSKDPREDSNQLVLAILQGDIPEARRQIAKLKGLLEKLRGQDSQLEAEVDGGVKEAEQLLAASEPLITAWQSGPPPEADHRFFANPHVRYLMHGDAALDDVNLPAYLAQAAPQRLALDDRTNALRAQLDAAVRGNAIDGVRRVAHPLRQSSTDQLKLDLEILGTLRRVNLAFVRRVGGAEVANFDFHRNVLAQGFDLQARPGPGGTAVFAGRITHAVERPGVKQRFLSLLAAYGQPFNGIVQVRNVGEDLVLTAADLPSFRGRMTVAVQGNLSLADFRVAAGGVVCFVCQGKLRARGQVDASLVALSSFEATGPLTVRGGLLLDRDCFRGGARPELLLQGVRVQDDPAMRVLDADLLTVRPESYRVIFGPHPVYETSLRQQAGAP